MTARPPRATARHRSEQTAIGKLHGKVSREAFGVRRIPALFHSFETKRRAPEYGAFFSGLFVLSLCPDSMAAISAWILIIASQNRSSSCFDSLSVGSIITVPATGQEMVGAWNP